MGRYALTLRRSASTTLAVGIVQAQADAKRIKIYYFNAGCDGASATNAFRWAIDRITAQGSLAGGTSVTPNPLDLADAAAESDALDTNITTNPTIGARVFEQDVYQQQPLVWYAPPRGELISPATDNLGFAVMTPISAALSVSSTMHYEE